MENGHDENKYKTFGIAYDRESQAQEAEFSIFMSIRPYIQTVKKQDGTFVKFLSADFPDVKVQEKKIIMPENGLLG